MGEGDRRAAGAAVAAGRAAQGLRGRVRRAPGGGLPAARLRHAAPVPPDLRGGAEAMRLDHVQVSCPPGGEDVARAFYRDALGMTEVAKPPLLAARGGCWFKEGSAEIHVGVEQDFRPARKAHPAFAVDDLDALAAKLEGLGYPITWD